MLSQKIPWYYSLPVIILSTLLAVILIYAWQEPIAPPPGGNVPAPINVGPSTQYKAGALGIGGVLRTDGPLAMYGTSSYLKLPSLTTSQRDALTPEDGMMIYNTVANELQIYSQGQWKVFSAIKRLALGQPCTLNIECASDYCVDGVCCDSACSGSICQRCDSYSVNGAGHCGYVSSSSEDPDDECGTSGCGIGNCKGDSYACGYYTSGQHNCGVCRECDSSGDCVAVSAGTDPYNNCDTAECGTGNCNASGVCDYYTSGKHNCGTCKTCDGATSPSCVNIASGLDPYAECGGSSCCGYCNGASGCAYRSAGSTCTSPGSSCNATHYRCDGSGNCTAPKTCSWTGCLNLGSTNCSNYCDTWSYACDGWAMIHYSNTICTEGESYNTYPYWECNKDGGGCKCCCCEYVY